jgi:cytochrome P450 PksS
MTVKLDISSQEYFQNPPAAIARLRAMGPVLKIRFPIVGEVWITTTQDLAGRVLKDSETFTLRKNVAVAGLRWWMPGIIRAVANNMLTMDEPDHTRLRELVDEAFRRRTILELEQRIRAIADELDGALFAGGSPADLVDRYARRVICEVLGLPEADRSKFMGWTNSFTRLTNLMGFLGLIPAMRAMKRYLEGAAGRRTARWRRGPGRRTRARREEGGRVTPEEMVAMVFLLLAPAPKPRRI